ncbi:hypothetical protein Nmel_008346, partial [Mimus melanotis]
CDEPRSQNLVQGTSLTAAPVHYSRQKGIPNWRSFEYSHKKEICKAQKEFGTKSEYFKALLHATFSSNILVPSDLKDLFLCLLHPTECGLWEAAWKQLLGDLLPELFQISEYAVDTDNKLITIEHLCSQGDSQVEGQAEKIPKPVILEVQAAAERAFAMLPGKEPRLNYTTTRQGMVEPLVNFIERLRLEVEKQVENKETQLEIIKEMVLLNSNEACKRVICSLPLYPKPTLNLMMEGCAQQATVPAISASTSRGPP